MSPNHVCYFSAVAFSGRAGPMLPSHRRAKGPQAVAGRVAGQELSGAAAAPDPVH